MGNNPKISNLRKLFSRLHHPDRGKLLTVWGKKALNKLWGKRPVSLSTLLFLLKIVPESKNVNGLFLYRDFDQSLGNGLLNSKLSNMLGNQLLGGWSLDVETINYLEKDIKKNRPKTILEFGSGISTLCLAQFLTEIHGNEPVVRVYSIEQDEKFAKESENLIRNQGYQQYARILHVPLSKGEVEGVEYCSYDLERIGELTDGAEFDYCLIDGPSVSGFDGRFATLPLVRKYLGNKARFVLDDALRSNELLTAKKWNQLPYIKIQGIVLTPKGLLVGFMKK